MIIVKKYKDIEIALPPVRSFEVSGEFRFVRYNSMMQVNLDTGWKPNRIVDVGIDGVMGGTWGNSGMYAQCYLGTSSTATNDAMFQLVAKVGTSIGPSSSFDNQWNTGAPFYARYSEDGYRFIPGNATSPNLREVGLHPTDEDKMFCRHIISPSISKASDETLDVFYRHACYPSLVDSSGVVVIDGVSYNWLARPADVATGTGLSHVRNIPSLYKGFTNLDRVYDGNINASITGLPSGTFWGGGGGGADTAYVLGTFYRTHTRTYDLNQGNITSGLGIRSVLLTSNRCDTQIQFDGPAGARIPKDLTKVLSFTYRTSWSRRS